MTIVTRFAPSPTGFLHIGGARTALFNWLLARHHQGRFLLRIEDTDRARSTQEAIDAIIHGMRWMGLEHDGEIVFQSQNLERHQAVARELLAQGKAYKCFTSQEELAALRADAEAKKQGFKFQSPWRDRDPSEAPDGAPYVVRIKAPQSGEMTINDQVQGSVTKPADDLDDLVMLRADGTPTYMLAVVVDDHDMGVTHVIRGDDHLNNAFRQKVIFDALGWDFPVQAHIPLIHGQDGAKLSKRHGALGVEWYEDAGFLPEAMRNYLLRLGWSHGDEEIIPTDQAIEWFDLDAVGKSPSRFDLEKLKHVNAHYMKTAEPEALLALLWQCLDAQGIAATSEQKAWITAGLASLVERAKTLPGLVEQAAIYYRPLPLPLDEKAAKALDADGLALLVAVKEFAQDLTDWQEEAVTSALKQFAAQRDLKIGKVFQPLRAALTGTMTSPGVSEVMAVLGKQETLRRIDSRLGALSDTDR